MSDMLLGKSREVRKQPIMWVRPPENRPEEDVKDLAIREGKWKLLMSIDGSHSELYDINANPGETINLAKENPDITAQLKSKLTDWFYETRSYANEPAKPWK